MISTSRRHRLQAVLLALAAVILTQGSFAQNCQRNFDCSGNQSCNRTLPGEEGQCQCQVGYKTREFFSDCEPIKCTRHSDCRDIFANTQCIGASLTSSGRCKCADGYQLDSDKLNCVMKTDSKENPKNDKTCFLASDCYQYENTDCIHGQCTCQADYEWDLAREKCTPKVYTLKYRNCSSSFDCGQNVHCSDNVCKCNYGHVATSTRDQCMPKHCSVDADCGEFQDASCEFNVCECKPYYQLDNNTQTCKPRKGPYCKTKENCGAHALCFDYKCKCQVGFTWVDSWKGCQPLNCRHRSDCENIFPNTRCSYEFGVYGRCVCDDGYELDNLRETCRESVALTTETEDTTENQRNRKCRRDSDCDDSFECLFNKCQCPHGKYLDEYANLCRLRIIPDDSHYHRYSHSHAGLIIGLSVGGAVLLVVTIVVAVGCYCKNKRKPAPVPRQQRPPVRVNQTVPPASDPTPIQPSAPSPPLPVRNTPQQPNVQPGYIPPQPSYNPYYFEPTVPGNAPPQYAPPPYNTSSGSKLYPTLPRE